MSPDPSELIEVELFSRVPIDLAYKLKSIKRWIDDLSTVAEGGPEYLRQLNAIASAVSGLRPEDGPVSATDDILF